MRSSYLKPLANCELKNGILTVPGLSSWGYYNLARELRKAIINYQVPHWKIVAIHIKLGDYSPFVDFVTKPNGVDKSYAELIPVLKKVAAARGGGEPAIVRNRTGESANCFYKVQGDMAFLSDTEEVINTYDGNLTYESFMSKPVKFLQAVDILNAKSGLVQAIMYRGTGVVEFSEAGDIVESYNTNDAVCNSGLQKVAYCPMTAVYDLSQFLTVKLPTQQDECVKFLYKGKVDEEVLQDILIQFGEEVQEGYYYGSH